MPTNSKKPEGHAEYSNSNMSVKRSSEVTSTRKAGGPSSHHSIVFNEVTGSQSNMGNSTAIQGAFGETQDVWKVSGKQTNSGSSLAVQGGASTEGARLLTDRAREAERDGDGDGNGNGGGGQGVGYELRDHRLGQGQREYRHEQREYRHDPRESGYR